VQAQQRAAAAVVAPAADPAVPADPAGMAAPVADCYPHQKPPKLHSCQAAVVAAVVATGVG